MHRESLRNAIDQNRSHEIYQSLQILNQLEGEGFEDEAGVHWKTLKKAHGVDREKSLIIFYL